jgi:hypothetical protein
MMEGWNVGRNGVLGEWGKEWGIGGMGEWGNGGMGKEMMGKARASASSSQSVSRGLIYQTQ